MDGFCPYRGGYVADRAAHDYPGVTVVPVVSDYVRGFLRLQPPQNQNEGAAEQWWESMRVPNSDKAWIEQFVFNKNGQLVDTIAVYCESDSGLAQAEVPPRVDGATTSRE
jgi:hypothetical protein